MSAGTVCPDCTSGEHHPTHDVMALDLNHGEQWCTCQCARIMTRQDPPVAKGDRVEIFAGRWAGRIMTVDDFTPRGAMYIGTVINHLSDLQVVHIPDIYTRPV